MKTKTTADFLNELKAKHGLKSNYALAKFLDQTDTAVARWAHGKGTFSDETALKISELLNYDPAYVMACMAAERSKDAKVKKTWEWTAQHLGGLAAALAFFAILPFIPLPSNGLMDAVSFDNNGYYANQNIHYAYLASCCLFIIIIALLAYPKGKSDDSKRG